MDVKEHEAAISALRRERQRLEQLLAEVNAGLTALNRIAEDE